MLVLKNVIYKMSPVICRIPFLNRYKGKLSIDYGNKILINNSVTVKGKNNRIVLSGRGGLKNCNIYIDGDNNTVIIGNNASLLDTKIHIENDRNTVTIGSGTIISGKTELACIEGTSITVGENCLFSANITIRTGDSHSVINEKGDRINPSKSINIGEHVWIGNTVIITKGVSIADNCVVGTGSVLTKTFSESNVIIAGNPGGIVKHGINWNKLRF